VKVRFTVTGFVLGVSATLAALSFPKQPAAGEDARVRGQMGKADFLRAVDAVFERYVDPVDGADLYAKALGAMTVGLDSHSHFLTRAQRRAIRAPGHEGHSGLVLALERDQLSEPARVLVRGVLHDSPAARSGLVPGDRIRRIGSLDPSFLWNVVEAERLLFGSPGERIEVEVERTVGQSVVFNLTLDAGPGAPVSARLISVGNQRIAQLCIHSFRVGVGEAVKRELAGLRRRAGVAGIAGLVIDLRGNPGGEVNEALIVADLFVDSGVLMRTRGRGGRILREERAHPQGSDTKTPLLVLQDRHSASSAELLAAALQENRRARVVGEKSFGKGTVQEVMGLVDGSVLTLTVARYFTPTDRSIDGVGVTPDERVQAGIVESSDPILSRALALLGSAGAPAGD
jgi:carboxyl-terminal processing protease